jgi:hypothetical protein
MVTIRVPASPTDQQFEKLSHEWNSARDAEIVLSRTMNDSERDAHFLARQAVLDQRKR